MRRGGRSQEKAHVQAPAVEAEPRELFVRSASRYGRAVVSMRARDLGDACVVDVEVEGREEAEPRSYSFADAQQASTFVTEAVEALVYLGCEIHA
jgi:hypothetical protein